MMISAVSLFRANLSFKLGLALAFIFLIGLLNAFAMKRIAAELSGAVDTINLADRLRMLSQRAIIDILATDPGSLESTRALESTVAEFEVGFNAIEHGGYAYGFFVKRPPEVPESQFDLIRDSWRSYRYQLFQLLLAGNPSEYAIEKSRVLSSSKKTLEHLESLVSMIIAGIQEREAEVRYGLYGIFIMYIIFLLAIFGYFRQRISKPLRDLAFTSQQFGAGQYCYRSLHIGSDEIGRLSSAFNHMADRLEHNFRELLAGAERDRNSLIKARKFSQVIERSQVSILITNPDGMIEYANPRFSEVSGYSNDEILGQPTRIFRSGQTPEAVYRDLWRTVRSGQPWRGNLLTRKKNGELIWELTRVSPLFDDDNNPINYVIVNEDITDQRAAENTRRLQQRAFEASSNGLVMIDAESEFYTVIYANPAFARITGYEIADVVGTRAALLLGFDDEGSLNAEVLGSLEHDDVHVWIAKAARKAGHDFWCEYAMVPLRDEERLITQYVVAVSDVTERIHYEQHLTFQATHDTLTGLANRTLFADRVEQAISHAQRYGQYVAIVLVDLDHFKYINDTLGHGVGDQLLKVVADRLSDCVRGIDTVARMGGDEFALILTQLHSSDETEAVLQRITASIASPYLLENHESLISCSAGASFYPKDGVNAEELLKNADTAMYQAKALGRNTYQFYQRVMSERLSQRLSLETQLRHALEREEFFVQYQPQIDLQSQAIVGVEALIRWQHPDLGLVPPSWFIPLAEEIGLILPIGEWVLHTACAQASKWNADGGSPLRVAVNLSAHQLQHKSLGSTIDSVLQLSALDPSFLEVEITESVIVDDVGIVIRLLRKLKDRGVSIALDDFGTGYASLSYLKRLPIDVLKIDQSFVRGIDVDNHDAALTRTVIALASSLGLRTVAEGVEMNSQADLLKAWGCNSAQGFFLHRPMSVANITQLLEANRVLVAREG
jgi:diguanylate cyclase (GGDEF)-like protein/PAS domain S-box-containing protein